MSYAALTAYMNRSQQEDAIAEDRGWTMTYRGDNHHLAKPWSFLSEKQQTKVRSQYPSVVYENHFWIPPFRTTESGGLLVFLGE